MVGQVNRVMRAAAFIVLALTAGAAPSWSAEKTDKSEKVERGGKAEGVLADYSNLDRDSDDVVGQMKGLLQEVYVAQTYALENQFRLDYGDHITIRTINYNSGGTLIPGHIFTPRTMAPGRRYPAVVMAHGAFHGNLEPVWFQIIDTLVSHGYVVFFPEYRGSKGYGAANYDNDYGVTDVADVLAGADYLANEPYVDPNRLAMFGESRGGMVAVLAIEQAPKRFKAAVDIVGLMDFVAYMSYKPDYRRKQVARESPGFGGKLPDKNLLEYMKVSPINAVEKIETPLLVLATTGDVSVPVSLNAGRLVDLLKAHGKLFDSKIYDNAPGGHEFMRGQTPERYDATARLVSWFDKYLK
jgi:dipeptidyl aminopeptidase/acylaminoacyl peptidase